MNRLTSHLVPGLLATTLLVIGAHESRAASATFNGNGSTSFNGGIGDGSLTVSDDGTGGVDFVFTLGNSFLGSGLGNGSSGNDIVIYLDNGTGGGIGTDTSGLTDAGDNGRIAISEYDGTDRSTLNFGGLMNPQYAFDLQSDFGDIFSLTDNGGNNSFTFKDGAAPGDTSGGGFSYSIAGDVVSLDVPQTDFGLNAFSGAALKFIATEVSETGFSSAETTGSFSGAGANGYGSTETLTNVNTFTTAVPEASTVGLLACGAGVLLMLRRRMGWLGRV